MVSSVKVEHIDDLCEGAPFVELVALKILESGLFTETEIIKPKPEEKTTVIHRKPRKERCKGKQVIGAKSDFWAIHNLSVAINDNTMTTASNRTRTYKLYKDFFKTEWANKKYFTINELKLAIYEKYGKSLENKMFDAHGFLHGYRFQIIAWSNGIFYENGELATKPICKKMDRGIFLNIFHKDAHNVSDFHKEKSKFTKRSK